MKNERILSYKMSQKISREDMQDVSAAGCSTNSVTGTLSGNHGMDYTIDVTWDM